MHVCKVAGDIFSGFVVDGIIGDRIVALARVRAAAARTGFNSENIGKPVDQNVRGPGQGLAVVILTGALRYKCDRAVPSPVSGCGVDPRKPREVDVIYDVAGVLDTIDNFRVIFHLI